KSWIKEGITWHCADAGDPELVSVLGPQDMIIANRFLCHMETAAAERILRNISRVVKPGGYLFVSGVDLNVRMRVALDMKWKAVTELMKEVHDGDPTIRDGWPFAGQRNRSTQGGAMQCFATHRPLRSSRSRLFEVRRLVHGNLVLVARTRSCVASA